MSKSIRPKIIQYQICHVDIDLRPWEQRLVATVPVPVLKIHGVDWVKATHMSAFIISRKVSKNSSTKFRNDEMK